MICNHRGCAQSKLTLLHFCSPVAAAAAAADGYDEIMEADLQDVDADHQTGVRGARGRVLVDALTARPFGEVLLSFSAVTPGSWAAGETEYGREFLYDSSRLRQLLGPFILQSTEGTRALAVTLEDVSAAAAVAHARLALLQAATSLFASLSRHAPARQQLMSADVCSSLMESSLQVGLATSRYLCFAYVSGVFIWSIVAHSQNHKIFRIRCCRQAGRQLLAHHVVLHRKVESGPAPIGGPCHRKCLGSWPLTSTQSYPVGSQVVSFCM